MRRLSFLPLMLLLPLAAAGQAVSADHAMSEQLLSQPQIQSDGSTYTQATPFWRNKDGQMLLLESANGSEAAHLGDSAGLAYPPVTSSNVATTGLRYVLAPNWQAHADVSEHTGLTPRSRILGSEVGATYMLGRYSVGLSVATDSTPDNNAALPRVLPGAKPGVNGLSDFDNSAQVSAQGRLALGYRSGIDLGASVGRIHLLPGNLLGVDAMEQKALSFGVDHGSLRGTLVGRSMEPQAGIPSSLSGDRHWNSIDLGVTWRLPWSGSLSVGAQNLWSSGSPSNTPIGPEPDQSRTPYVQYHQDL